MPNETIPAKVTLYYRAGGSDKVYSASIEPAGKQFVVNFAYGRRGSTMNAGTKTNQPVDYPAAKKIYDGLIKEKTAKGYKPGADGTPYLQTDKADRATGILPQLLNSIDEPEAQKLLSDSAWWAQEKLDGKRVLIRRTEDQITGINRLGLVIAQPEPIVAAALTLGSQQWLMDGEAIGDVWIAFDLLENACDDLRAQPYSVRIKALREILGTASGPIRCVATAATVSEKKALWAKLVAEKREGIVFKRHTAAHTPGRPASGGDQLKLKFTATASCIVAAANGAKRSVKLELIDAGKRVGVGNVTIPANRTIPAKGEIVEVRYLYAFAGGSLYQPVYQGPRDDISDDACTIQQLKFKPEESDDA